MVLIKLQMKIIWETKIFLRKAKGLLLVKGICFFTFGKIIWNSLMLRYIVTMILYEVEEDETFISNRLVQCAFEYISTKPKLSFIRLWHWCGKSSFSSGTVRDAGQMCRARDVLQLLLRPVCFTAKVQGNELKCWQLHSSSAIAVFYLEWYHSRRTALPSHLSQVSAQPAWEMLYREKLSMLWSSAWVGWCGHSLAAKVAFAR